MLCNLKCYKNREVVEVIVTLLLMSFINKKTDRQSEFSVKEIAEGIDATISTETLKNGDLFVTFKEGDKYDELQFCQNGQILQEGSPITITQTVSSQKIPNETLGTENIIVPFAHRMYYTESCPYDYAGAYTKFVSSQSKNLTFNKVISDMTVAAVCSVIIPLLISGDIPGAIITGLVAGFIAWKNINDPYSKAASMKETAYVHKTKGFNVTSNMSVKQWFVDLFAFTGCRTNLGTKMYYQVFSY